MNGLRWNKAQSKAIEYAVDKKVPRLLIIGGAGTGKTAVLKEIIRRLQYMGKDVIAAAPTGVAALNIKSDAFGSGSVGMTIHSFHISILIPDSHSESRQSHIRLFKDDFRKLVQMH